MPGAHYGLVWLDGGNDERPSEQGGDMSLRFGAYAPDGRQTAESALDPRVCECCPTAAAVTSEGPIVAYRDRSTNEVRDIYVTRLVNGKWTPARPVHQDDRRINACPVNGPSLSARGRRSRRLVLGERRPAEIVRGVLHRRWTHLQCAGAPR